MRALLADLAVVYCSAASWAVAAGDLRKALELVRQAEACLDQRKRQVAGEAAPVWFPVGIRHPFRNHCNVPAKDSNFLILSLPVHSEPECIRKERELQSA